MHSYTNEFSYSDIGNMMRKNQSVYAKGQKDAALTYEYAYRYTSPKPHAVTGINENLTYRYDANGNMTAMYDTAKNYNRVLYWDDDNRLTKTVDTTAGSSVATTYAYDAKGMRIVKDGPYGKSIYVDTGYVLSQEYVESNHVFVGNTRIVSVVKHKDETQPATYYYATDHLGSSSVLTTSTGSYHERIEYLPYGEVWVEDAVNRNGYNTPYKFTGKELDKETGLYYFGARYYDPRTAVWGSADPALGKYLTRKDGNSVFVPGLLNLYNYSALNPVKYIDPNGEEPFIASRDLNTDATAGVGVHSFIAIVTDNPKKYGVHASKFHEFKNSTGKFPNVEKGKSFYVATLSGISKSGKLVKDVNNVADKQAIAEIAEGTSFLSPDFDLELFKLVPKKGMTEFEMERNMLDVFDSYDDKVDYSAFAFGDKRNCHSLSGTVAKKAGAINVPSNLTGADPGMGTTIPDKHFSVKKSK